MTYRLLMGYGRYLTGLIVATVLVAITTVAIAPASAAALPRVTASASSAHLRFGVTVSGGPLATTAVASVAQLAGERPSIEMWYEDFAQAVPTAELTAVASRGATPIITWEPWLWGGGVRQPAYALDRIAAGDHDAYIRSFATGLRNWAKPVTLRFAQEMNGSWYPWAEGVNGNGAGDYVRAWRHVHDVVVAAGATNVSWMWSPNTLPTGTVGLPALYPGAGFVDAVALDGYNWGSTQTWSSWTSPTVLFGRGLAALRSVAPGKPITIAETAAAEAGGSKPVWIRDLLSYLSAQPDVSAFIWFQMNKETDWRFNSSSGSTAAFAAALARRR